MKKIVIAFYISFCLFISVNAQKLSIKDNLSNIHSRILSDSLIMTLKDNSFTDFDVREFFGSFEFSYKNQQDVSIDFNRSFIFEIKDSIGLKKFSRISLPESVDPTYFFHSPEVFKINNHYVMNSKIDFSAKSIDSNGQKTNLKYKVSDIKAHNRLHYSKIDNAEEQIIDIQGLKIGTSIEYKYKYSISVINNIENLISFNHFFDSPETKENFYLQINNKSYFNFEVKQNNGALKLYSVDSLGVNHWSAKNLNGGIDEEGSRPYTELPYISILLKPGMISINYDAFNESEPVVVDYYPIINNINNIKKISKDEFYKTTEYKDIISYCDFLKQGLSVDSAKLYAISKIHNNIVDLYEYIDNESFFSSYQLITDNIKMNIEKKQLCEATKGKLYATYLSYLDLPYRIAYIDDNRSSEINRSYIRPLFNNNYYFVIDIDSNLMIYLKPKNSDFGYYINEFPFYYENTISRHFYPEKLFLKDSNDAIPVYFYKTPCSLIQNNERRINIIGNVDIASLSINFNSKVSLKGQYSTLTRSVYLFDYIDPTINPLYKKTIYSSKNFKIKSLKNIESQKTEPFKSVFDINYSSEKSITKISDSIFQIDFSNWITHIINNISLPRNTNYYPDFPGKDQYTLILNFSEKIQLIENLNEIKIENEFGRFDFSMVQLNENTISIGSFFVIKTRLVKKENIDNVISIFEKIKEIKEKSNLKFKII